MKKNEKKSFYFEDYNDSEFIYGKKNNNEAKISLTRINFLYFIFISLIFIFSIKIVYISVAPENFFYTKSSSNDLVKIRRNIVDRNNSLLATNVYLYDVGIRPKLLNKKEKKNLLIKLSILFPTL